MGYIGEVRYRRYSYKGYPQWRVNVPNCESEDYVLKVTCQPDMLRVDVNRKLHASSTSHGIIGEQSSSKYPASLRPGMSKKKTD